MDTDVLYWIWLSDALGASNKQTGALLSAIPDALEIYRMDAVALCDRVPKLSRAVVENLSQKSLEHAKRVEEYCLRHGIGILPVFRCILSGSFETDFFPAGIVIL